MVVVVAMMMTMIVMLMMMMMLMMIMMMIKTHTFMQVVITMFMDSHEQEIKAGGCNRTCSMIGLQVMLLTSHTSHLTPHTRAGFPLRLQPRSVAHSRRRLLLCTCRHAVAVPALVWRQRRGYHTAAYMQ